METAKVWARGALAAVGAAEDVARDALRVAGVERVPSEAIWGAAALIALAVIMIVVQLARPRVRRGFGAGENSNWNRRINTARPVFAQKHFKLPHVWRYAGAGDAQPDLTIVRDAPLSTPSCTDPVTGLPLSGHLIGRQTWVPDLTASAAARAAQDTLTWDPAENPNAGDKLLRAQLLAANGGNPAHANPPAPRGEAAAASMTPEAALQAGWDFFCKLQCEDGHWAGDYGGPLFLLPGLVLTALITGVDLGDAKRAAMLVYIANHQQADGGWGLHIEGPSTVFSTTLNYAAARALGVGKDEPLAVAARAFLHRHGGAVANPTWGKFWLAQLGAYEWEGVNPIPPELWLLPRWFPFHPGKLWCHYRMNYLPMSAIYGKRWGARPGSPAAALGLALREELYPPAAPFAAVDWDAVRSHVADTDLYAPHTPWVTAAFHALRAWERWAPSFLARPLRRAGVAFAVEYCGGEDVHTNWMCIGPVNKVLNTLVAFYAHGAASPLFTRHVPRFDDYLWVAEDGMKMQGYNGSQLWDTSFAAQALAASGMARRYAGPLARVHSYLDASQIKADVPHAERFFRTPSAGGWPFSTNDHGWPIADCTAEGLKAALAIRELAIAGEVPLGAGEGADGFGTPGKGLIPAARLAAAVDILLVLHNPGEGGWATYETQRGGAWYEALNPAEVWADLMVDYQYTELTCASLTGLLAFRKAFPGPAAHRAREVDAAIASGVEYVRAQQRADGSWYGSWAVCFTYGAWFGTEALLKGGDPTGADRAALEASSAFLLSKQQADGGWGESYLSCLLKEYSAGPSNAVNTAWALLALINAQCPDAEAVARGVRFLISRQTPGGDWAQEACSGIFNRTCAITYTSYRNVFPLWALAAYANHYRARATVRGPLGLAVLSRANTSLGSAATSASAAASAKPAGKRAAGSTADEEWDGTDGEGDEAEGEEWDGEGASFSYSSVDEEQREVEVEVSGSGRGSSDDEEEEEKEKPAPAPRGRAPAPASSAAPKAAKGPSVLQRRRAGSGVPAPRAAASRR